MWFREIQKINYTKSVETLVDDIVLLTIDNNDKFFKIFEMLDMLVTCQSQ
jgi:hypothetical protein